MKFTLTITLCSLWFGATLASAQITSFKHVVIIVQENRTPDNLFQGLCSPPFGSPGIPGLPGSCSVSPRSSQYNIQTSNWKDNGRFLGTTDPNPVPLAAPYDLDHSHAAFLAMCNPDGRGNCQMDGASNIRCSGTCPQQPQFGYVDNSGGLLNPYLELATQYGWANYMFQTNQGPSFPAHLFLFGGTSAPSAFDDQSGIFAAENPLGGHFNLSGCTAPAGIVVPLIDRSGTENQNVYPCFEHKTVVDLLPKGISWKYYTPGAGSIWTAPNAIEHICESTGKGGHCSGLDWVDHVDLVPSDVLRDISSCNLSSLSWVIPSGPNSDHSEHNDGGGPSWVAAVVNAIGNSKACDHGNGYWKDTAILITWDDWGGWYDHEPPVLSSHSEYEYGFRVPLVVVSAYTPQRYINNNRQDFGSMLRFVERNFDVPEGSLHFADARAQTDLGFFFNLRAAPRPYTNISAQKSTQFFLQDARPMADPDDE